MSDEKRQPGVPEPPGSGERPRSMERRGVTDVRHREDDPPVVARMVVEVRSDGTRTIARGAIHDAFSGETLSLEAEGTTPADLARSLAKSLVQVPLMVSPIRGARKVVQGLTRAVARAGSAGARTLGPGRGRAGLEARQGGQGAGDARAEGRRASPEDDEPA